MAKNERIGAWSIGGIELATATSNSPSLIIVRDIVRNVMDRIVKVELQLCAHNGDEPHIEPCINGDDAQLSSISVTMFKQARGQ